MKRFLLKKDVDTAQLAGGEKFAIGFPKFYGVYKYTAHTDSFTWMYWVGL